MRTRGFTLIEVVISLALFVALSVGAATLLTLTLNTIARSRERTMALVLARSKLEQLLSDGVTGPDDADHPDGYERRWTITRSGTGAAELLIVQVTVTRRPDDAVWIAGARVRRGL